MERMRCWVCLLISLILGLWVSDTAEGLTLFTHVNLGNGYVYSGPNPSGRTDGSVFNVRTKDIYVTHLGAFDNGGNGFNGPVHVGIWNELGALQAYAVIPAGTEAPGDSSSGFVTRYTPLSSVVLLKKNTTYRVGVWYQNMFDFGLAHCTNTIFRNDFSYGTAAGALGVSCYPELDGWSQLGFPLLGMTFEYYTANFQYSYVPEPSSLMLFGFLGFLKWVQRR